MKNNRLYITLYYICFILSLACLYLTLTLSDDAIFSTTITLLVILNAFFVIAISIGYLIKTKFDFKTLVMPISYIVFVFIMICLAKIYNNYVVIPYIHLSYFLSFIIVYYTLLNVYTILCVGNNKKKINIFNKIKK